MIVPFGNDQCVSVCHRVEGRRQVDNFELGGSGKTNYFISPKLFETLEIHWSRAIDDHRTNAALLTLLCEPAEYPLVHFRDIGKQAPFDHDVGHSAMDTGFVDDPSQELAIMRRRVDSQSQGFPHVLDEQLPLDRCNGAYRRIGSVFEADLL